MSGDSINPVATEKHFERFDTTGNYLGSHDLLIDGQFRTVELTICGYEPQMTVKRADGQLINKPILSFKGKSKKLILNKTNEGALHFTIGDNRVESLMGRKIRVQARMFKGMGGNIQIGLRIIPPKGIMLPSKLIERIGVPAEWGGVSQSGQEAISRVNSQAGSGDAGGVEGDHGEHE